MAASKHRFSHSKMIPSFPQTNAKTARIEKEKCEATETLDVNNPDGGAVWLLTVYWWKAANDRGCSKNNFG